MVDSAICTRAQYSTTGFRLCSRHTRVHPPDLTNWPLAATKRFLQYRQQLDCPAVHSRMIGRNATLSHHFFEVPQAQRIGHKLAHASQNHIERIMQAFEHSGRHWIQCLHRAFSRSCRSAHNSGPPYCNRAAETRHALQSAGRGWREEGDAPNGEGHSNGASSEHRQHHDAKPHSPSLRLRLTTGGMQADRH